jgi:mycofactocin precursor
MVASQGDADRRPKADRMKRLRMAADGMGITEVQYPVPAPVSPGQRSGPAAERVMRAKEDPQVTAHEHPTDTSGGSTIGQPEEPRVIEEIEVEDLTVDGICGVY